MQAARGRGLNRIEHRFGLGEIQPAVEKRSLGKLAGLRQPGAMPDQAVAGGLQDPGPAMGLDFHHVFARIRTRLAHDDDQGFIDGRGLALSRRERGFRIQNVAQIQAVTFQLLQGLPTAGTNDVSGDVNGVCTADPDDSDSAFSHGSGDRTNGIVNRVFHRRTRYSLACWSA